ncbi:MAG: hypothetical protein OHK0013_04200 [Sandaracinaceae bacterium]
MRAPPQDEDPALRLAALRSEIDRVDEALVALLADRRAVVQRMRALKEAHGLPRLDAAREARMRASLEAAARARDVPIALLHAVLDAILADSRALVSSDPHE